jgi:hypothetical protein
MANQYRLNEPEWDDEAYSTYAEYDDDENYGNDDESFLGGLFSSGLNAAGSLLSGNPLGAVKSIGSSIGSVLGVNPTPASTAGIQSRSNLSGQVQTAGGRQVPLKLPESVATKQDINILQGAIQKINGEIKKVAETTTTNGVALTKLSKEVKTVDDKHVSVSKKQNDLISKLGTGVNKLEKDFKILKSQEQMNMMLSMFLQPKLESVTFATARDASGNPIHVVSDETKPFAVKTSKSTDNTLLLLMMGMMGGEGSSGGGFGDMGNNPLMMILMLKAIGGGGSIF